MDTNFRSSLMMTSLNDTQKSGGLKICAWNRAKLGGCEMGGMQYDAMCRSLHNVTVGARPCDSTCTPDVTLVQSYMISAEWYRYLNKLAVGDNMTDVLMEGPGGFVCQENSTTLSADDSAGTRHRHRSTGKHHSTKALEPGVQPLGLKIRKNPILIC